MTENPGSAGNDVPDVAALREALAAIREEYEHEDVPAVKAGLSIAFDAVRVVLNQHEARVLPPAVCPCGHPDDDHDDQGACMHLCDCAWPIPPLDAEWHRRRDV